MNITRPSSGEVSVMARAWPMRWRATATCAPLVRRSSGAAAGSSSRRTWSAQGPVAFTTTSARTLDSSPLSLSRTPALARCLAHKVEFVLLEVAQAAVDQPRRMRRRAAREVALVHHGGAKAAQRGVARDPGAGDAAADDQHVHRLGRHRREGLGARAM